MDLIFLLFLGFTDFKGFHKKRYRIRTFVCEKFLSNDHVCHSHHTMNRRSAASCFITRSKDKDDRRGNSEPAGYKVTREVSATFIRYPQTIYTPC